MKNHYVMMETEGLAHLCPIIFNLKETKITSTRKVREMMTPSMISEEEDKEAALLGSHKGLRSSSMLHHECRHMTAHLRNTKKEPTITMDSPETAELRLMTSYASEDQTPVANCCWTRDGAD